MYHCIKYFKISDERFIIDIINTKKINKNK